MSIENTTRTAQETPIIPFVGMLDDPSAFIERQEAQGQAQVVNSTQLPAQGDWDALIALGFTKGEPVPGDDLFVEATIPEGWTKERTDHSMYSVIKDTRGVERVSVGYKAAWYDRWASISVMRPGTDVWRNLAYADTDPTELPTVWTVLTDAEREDARQRAREYLVQRREWAEKYGDEDGDVARAELVVELLGA